MAKDHGDLAQPPDARVHTGSDVEKRDILETLARARARVVTALRRLNAIQLEVLLGTRDLEQYDAALLDYRAAQAALRVAQAAEDGLDAGALLQGAPAEGHPQPAGPATEPTAALRFARWLVEHGRLSEWNVRKEEAESCDAPPARLTFARWLVQTGRLSEWA
jgi:hypothetical protein